ncbi:hypothetical protein FVB9288_03092 [Flavobacterium sp. CECT 9288]|uniref:hypothetical protein n=1 Tax=Flavobacterium sp. CECT 9288 TaxID=2845819 RepID=UPI001E408877|nr:hypothetical protein [Flavobacterium sp. CECT 9288]CAH0337337.1 hypothetical protein FVB9288_03092 [Flavobacterium sp. CECT 9288]
MQNETTIKTVSKQEAIQFLQNSNGLNGNKSKSTNVPLVYDFEKITQEKTSHKEALITVIPAQSDIKGKKTRVILWKVDNAIESIVYNEYASASSTINSFTGIIIIKRLNGDFVRAYKLKNNDYVIDLLPIKKDATSKSSNSFGEEPIGLHEVIVINNFKKTSYNFVPMIDRNKSVSDVEDYYWLKSGGGGGYTGAEPVEEEVDFEDKIDDSELDPCTKEVLDKLKTLSQNDIASIFEKFGIPENGTYNIKMVSGPLNSSVATADTKWISKNNYLITVSDSYTKGTANYQKPPTDLAVAAVIVHELIHAHFFALFDDFHNNGNVCAYDSFDCLFEKFVSKNYTGTIDEQHAQMFDNFVPKMAAILQEFKPGLSTQFYEDLAMSTMVDLQYFNDRFPKGSLDRVRIENTRYSEDLNIPKGDATPKGSPCN